MANITPNLKREKIAEADIRTCFKSRNIYAGASVVRYEKLMNACTQEASKERGTPFGASRNDMFSRLHVDVLKSHFLPFSERLDLIKLHRAH
jgi:hypothetical protein